jgi:signal transduction histidine kinase
MMVYCHTIRWIIGNYYWIGQISESLQIQVGEIGPLGKISNKMALAGCPMRYKALFSQILIVDSDRTAVRSLSVLLQNVGYIVRAVTSLTEAQSFLIIKKPDLVWLAADLSLADDHAFIREFKSQPDYQIIPILIAYQADDLMTATACLNAGADDLIAAPFDHTIALIRIRALLRQKSTSQDLLDLTEHLEEKVHERTIELEKVNARLRHSEKLSSLGRLASSIVHEINNPITGMMLNVGIMEETLPVDSGLRVNLKLFSQMLDHISSLVQQLRTFSKPVSAAPDWVQVNELIGQTGMLLEKQFKKDRIHLVMQLDDAVPKLWLPADQLREVTLNLAVNAADAMPHGGLLTLSTRLVDHRVELCVADNGEGIEPELLDRIFEPFFTTKGEKGTGLGLAITYKIVQSMGGEIGVESQPGLGTRFTISLPYKANDATMEQVG